MESEILQADEFKIGDLVEIIDSRGSNFGQQGDHGNIIRFKEGDGNEMIGVVRLINGDSEGDTTTRYLRRYKLIQSEWD